MGSTATGVNPDLIGQRLTNLTQLTIDTSWWTRYRDDSHNPDLDPNHVFPQAVPTLGGKPAYGNSQNGCGHNAILISYRRSRILRLSTFRPLNKVATAFTHHWHSGPPMTEVLRILISIGPTETMHFQTWSDVAGNAPPLTAVDPVTGCSVTFPDLEVEDELFDKALIMPEPCPFLDRKSSYLFDHSTDQNGRRCDGCSAVPDRHGTFHRPIAGVLCVYDPAGTTRRPCQSRRSSALRNVTAGSTVKPQDQGWSRVRDTRPAKGEGPIPLPSESR